EAVIGALTTMDDGRPGEFAVVDLRVAWSLLGSITGDTVHDDIVEEIFSRFCLGNFRGVTMFTVDTYDVIVVGGGHAR
ncbi:hypothetical protein NE675_11935, partial [Megasphaera massiliensis]|nr:hypothetical protein [Megasphaera massiliensis]